ncbi:MAG: ribbon-helix-helix protein, CopG family [Acidobacteriota bacterium]
MVRTQIQLDEKRYQRLQEVAREEGVSMAEMVRVGIDMALAQFERQSRWERARALVGKYASGKADVARRHDEYLSQVYKK